MSIVISCFDRTGNMVRPWAEAGYTCYCVDLQHAPGEHREGNIIHVGADMLDWMPPRGDIAFAAFFPPCTDVAVSGARWFKDKGIGALINALRLFEVSVKLAEWARAPYLIENPISTISSYWRKPDHIFNPCDYGGYLTPPRRRLHQENMPLDRRRFCDACPTPDRAGRGQQDAPAATERGAGQSSERHADGICPRGIRRKCRRAAGCGMSLYRINRRTPGQDRTACTWCGQHCRVTLHPREQADIGTDALSTCARGRLRDMRRYGVDVREMTRRAG